MNWYLTAASFKGVVRSKIEFFENWICESRRPMRDIAFYPNKIGQKLTENRGVKHANFKSQNLGKIGWLNTTLEVLLDDVGLPRIKMHSCRTRTHADAHRLELGFASPTKSMRSDWSSRELARIWLVDFSVTCLVRKIFLAFWVSQSRTNIVFWERGIWRPSSRSIFVRFCSGKKQCLS